MTPLKSRDLQVLLLSAASLLCASCSPTSLPPSTPPPEDKSNIVERPAHDPELEAATAKARERFNEFVLAVSHRKDSEQYAVKASFPAQGSAEHMWVDVTAIDGTTIRGTLQNDPIKATSLHCGDPVTVDVDDVEDWLYTEDGKNIGLFTAPVLLRRAGSKQP